MKMRTPLRTRLLHHINWNTFPSPTMHIKGWPIQLWEAIIANIDAKALLYAICKGGTYNVRSFSSMMGETFFSELLHLEKVAKEQLDPERCFAYRTSVSTLYKPEEKWSSNSIAEMVDCGDSNSSELITSIIPKNLFFDEKPRTRVKGKRKEGQFDRDRNAVLKGTLGVRWETARRNEGKMLLTKKNGI
ncbi:unnamed protein product [Mytilus coruscus]|uniref:Uncharacterized protein n=1 Tax=Mytilus coruscus TaxID=42192 RepID=A0A6J7ZXZ1_MYTCO|nr:unnamed protein product [Mytilus coruscus]